MALEETQKTPVAASNPFTVDDVVVILTECGWLSGPPAPEQAAWCERAAALLGVQAADRGALRDLLALVFQYDAKKILGRVESHTVISRHAAREVLRQVARMLLENGPLTTERFNEIIAALKVGMDLRAREIFHPLRLALTGRAGEGELDRVILLLDDAAALGFATPVKPARGRILEFCASLD